MDAKGKPISFGSLDAVLQATSTYTPPRSDAGSLLAMYNTNPWVRSIVGRVGGLVAKQPWQIQDSKGQEIPNHPATLFLKYGTPLLPGRKAIKMTQVQLDLAGECFWIIGRDARGLPASYAVMTATECQDIPTRDRPTFEFLKSNGTALSVPEADVIWFKDCDPTDMYGRGRSITGAATVEVATSEAASEHVLNHLQNRARPDYIISGTKDAPISPQDRPAFETSFLGKFKGKGNGKPWVTSHEVKVTPLGASLKDTEMSTLQPELRAAITEIYGVPPEVFGRIENSNRATIESADFLLAVHTVEPRLDDLCETLAPFIEREFKLSGGQKLAFVSPVKRDRAFQLAVMQARPQSFTGNEFRNLADMESMDGLDELIPEPAPFDPFGGGGGGSDPAGDTEEDGKDAGKETENGNTKAVANPNAPAHTDGAAYPASFKQLAPADVVEVSGVLEDPQVKATVTAIIDQLYQRLIERYGIGLLTMLEKDASFQLNTAVANWLATEIPHLMDGVNTTTREALKAALVTGVAEDELAAELIARVDNVFASAADTRAGIISQTEATKLAGFATQEAATQAGFEQKMWLTSGDQVVRGDHARMDGQVRHVTEAFTAPDGSTAMYPGGFGKAGQDINCRCAIRPVTDGEATKAFGDEFPTFHAHALDRMSKDINRAMQQIFGLQKRLVVDTLKARAGI